MVDYISMTSLLVLTAAIFWRVGHARGLKQGYSAGSANGYMRGKKHAALRALRKKERPGRTLKQRLEDLGFEMKKPDQAVIDETWWYATQYTIVVGVGPTNMMGCECCGSANEIYSVHGQGKIHVGLYGIFCLVCGRGLRVTDDNSVIERDLTRVLPRWEENDFSAEVIHLVPKAQNDGNLHLQHSLPHRPTSHSSGALTFWANSGILEAHPAH